MISVENITILLIMNEDEASWVMRQHPSVWFLVMMWKWDCKNVILSHSFSLSCNLSF